MVYRVFHVDLRIPAALGTTAMLMAAPMPPTDREAILVKALMNQINLA